MQQGDQWYSEHDGKTYPTRERRYIMRVKAADASGECFLHLFNDQVRIKPYNPEDLKLQRPRPSMRELPTSGRPPQRQGRGGGPSQA